MLKVTSLRDSTRQMLIDRPASVSASTIAKDLGVSVDWLHKFAQGKIPNPGVVTVESLHTYLTSKVCR